MPIASYDKYPEFKEAYELMRTVELRGSNELRYRLEVFRCYSNDDTPFTVRAFVGQPVASQIVWSDLSAYPFVSGETPQAALHEGMRALASIIAGSKAS